MGPYSSKGPPFFESWKTHAQLQQQKGRADPIWRRLDVLVLLIIGVVQFGVEKQPGGASVLLRGSPDEMLSLEEIKRYSKRPSRNVFDGGGESTSS